MARPIKVGLDYFPIDVDLDLDDKLGMIIGEFGYRGELLWTKLLSWIYRNNGYFCEWDEDVQLRFLRRYNYCGFSMSFIQEVVPRFVKWGLLDKTVFNTFHILTSQRIQKTWLDATRKRKEPEIDKKIWILSVNDGNQAEETKITAEVIDKLNKSKVKEIKEKNDCMDESPGETPVDSPLKNSQVEKQKKMLNRQQKFYEELAGYVSQYSKELLRAFYNYWSEPNKSKTRMKFELEQTWETKLRLITWEKNEQKFNKGKTVNNEQSSESKQAALSERERVLANTINKAAGNG